jgi:hypothetical protein
MRSAFAVTTSLLLLLGSSVADAADPTQLAETGGVLLGNARRCGVAVERVESAGKVIDDFIAAAASDASEAAAADSRFSELFVASALPDPDPYAFPSCTVVIQQFDRLDDTMTRPAGTAKPEFVGCCRELAECWGGGKENARWDNTTD